MTEDKRTFKMGKANLMAFVFGIPLIGILILPYYFAYGIESTNQIRLFFALRTFIALSTKAFVIHRFPSLSKAGLFTLTSMYAGFGGVRTSDSKPFGPVFA